MCEVKQKKYIDVTFLRCNNISNNCAINVGLFTFSLRSPLAVGIE